jgi:hypothetical protein
LKERFVFPSSYFPKAFQQVWYKHMNNLLNKVLN